MGQFLDVRAVDLVFFVKMTNICAFLGHLSSFSGLDGECCPPILVRDIALACAPRYILSNVRLCGCVRRRFSAGYSLGMCP